jgi:hypothetical protein
MPIATTTLSPSNVGDKSVTLSWIKADLSNNNVKTASILLYDVSLNTIKSTPIPSYLLAADASNSLIFNNIINGHGYEASIVGYDASNVQTLGSTNNCSFTPSGPPDAVVLSNATFDSSNNTITINCQFGNDGGTPVKSLILTVFANDLSNNTPDVSYNVINFSGDIQIKNNKYTAIIPALNYNLGAVNTIAGVALNAYGQSEISNSVFVQTSNKPAQGIFLSATSGVYGNVDASGNLTNVGNISAITGNSGINPDTFKSVIPVSFSFGYENSNKSVTSFKVNYIGYTRAENMDGSGNTGTQLTQNFVIPSNYIWTDSNIFNFNLVPGRNYVAFKNFTVVATNAKGDSPVSITNPKITAVTVLPPVLPDISGNNYSVAVDISSCTVTFPSQVAKDISGNEPIIYTVKLRDQSNNDVGTLDTTLNTVTFLSTYKEKVIYTAQIIAKCYVNPSLTDYWATPLPALTQLASNKIIVSGYIPVPPDAPTNLATITDVMSYTGTLSTYTSKSGVVSVSWDPSQFTGFILSSQVQYDVTLSTNAPESGSIVLPSSMTSDNLAKLYGQLGPSAAAAYKTTITVSGGITNAFFSDLGSALVNGVPTRIVIPVSTAIFISVVARNGNKKSSPASLPAPIYCNSDTFDRTNISATAIPSVDGGKTSKVNVTINKPQASAIPAGAIPRTITLARDDDSGSNSHLVLQTYDYDPAASTYKFTDSLGSSNKKYTYSAQIIGLGSDGKPSNGLISYTNPPVSYVSIPTITDVKVGPDVNAGITNVTFTINKNGTGTLVGGICLVPNCINGTGSVLITSADDNPNSETVLISKDIMDLPLSPNPSANIYAATIHSSVTFPAANAN